MGGGWCRCDMWVLGWGEDGVGAICRWGGERMV